MAKGILNVGGGVVSVDASGNFTVDTGLIADGASVFNETGVDVDFRVESDDNPNMIFVDGGNDRVGIGVATPKTHLTVDGTLTLKEQAEAETNTAAYGQLWVNTATPNELYFTTDADNDIQITTGTRLAATPADGAQIFNESGADVDFRIESDDNTHMIFVDGGNDRVGIGTNAPASLLDVQGTVQVGVSGTGYDFNFYADSSTAYMKWDESESELVLLNVSMLSFWDVSGGERIFASADGHLNVDAGTTLDLDAPEVAMRKNAIRNPRFQAWVMGG